MGYDVMSGDDTFQNTHGPSTGGYPLDPKKPWTGKEKVYGGHAVTGTGYGQFVDRKGKLVRFIVQENSWGMQADLGYQYYNVDWETRNMMLKKAKADKGVKPFMIEYEAADLCGLPKDLRPTKIFGQNYDCDKFTGPDAVFKPYHDMLVDEKGNRKTDQIKQLVGPFDNDQKEKHYGWSVNPKVPQYDLPEVVNRRRMSRRHLLEVASDSVAPLVVDAKPTGAIEELPNEECNTSPAVLGPLDSVLPDLERGLSVGGKKLSIKLGNVSKCTTQVQNAHHMDLDITVTYGEDVRNISITMNVEPGTPCSAYMKSGNREGFCPPDKIAPKVSRARRSRRQMRRQRRSRSSRGTATRSTSVLR